MQFYLLYFLPFSFNTFIVNLFFRIIFLLFFLFFRVLMPNFATILVLKNDLLRIKRNMEMI